MKTQFEVNEDFRVMENEELVYMLTKRMISAKRQRKTFSAILTHHLFLMSFHK